VKKFLLALCCMMLGIVHAQDIYQATLNKEVKFITDLQADLALAKSQKKPLLILFSQVDCRFCHNVRSQHLKHIATDAKAPVIVREVMAGAGHSVGKESADALYKRLGIKFFPTVVLYDSQLKAISEPLLGSDTSGFYATYLDAAIQAGVAAIK
jgi:thioredoxin-related protein